MPDRDWEKELAKVDKQLASLSDEALLQPAGSGKREAGSGVSSAKTAKAPVSADTGDVGGGRARWGMYARVTLSVALGVGMVLWPYEAKCGFGLAGYLAAVVVLITSGVWSSIWTWRHRASRSHTLSLLIVLWGLILGVVEVLPRIGYAKPDARHPAGWTCSAPTPAPTPPAKPTTK